MPAVQNEANRSGRARQWARGGKSAPPASPGPNMRNEANLARTDRNGHAPLGLSVRNKANSSGAARKASTLRERSYGQFSIHEVPVKRSQFTRTDGDGARDARPAACPLEPASQSCKTNPIWPGSRDAGLLEGGSCKTNPISAGQPEPQGPSVRNKANSSGRTARGRSEDLPWGRQAGRLSREGKGFARPHKAHVRKE